MATPFLSLPGEIRNQIYTRLLVSPKPLNYLFSKQGVAPNILYTNKIIHDEARSILYGCNWVDFTGGYLATLDFLRRIGRDNAVLIQSIRIFFPAFPVGEMFKDDGGGDSSGEVVTRDNIQPKMMSFLASHGVSPRRITTTWQSSAGLVRQLDSLPGGAAAVDEKLALVDARFRLGESVPRDIVVEVYHNDISKDVERAMERFGWKVRRIVRYFTSDEDKEDALKAIARGDHLFTLTMLCVGPIESQYRHLFYMSHPSDAQYRTDIPAYYITAVDKETLGNIHLGTSKSRLRKMEFEALLSSKQTASDRPLFDEAGKASTLFTARPAKLMGSRYNWIQEDGSQVAVEEGKDDEDKMVIAAPMTEEMRDALVAVWMLKLWYETAETRQAKREELERMMPPVSSYQDWNYAKKVGTLGGFAGAGGGGNGC